MTDPMGGFGRELQRRETRFCSVFYLNALRGAPKRH